MEQREQQLPQKELVRLWLAVLKERTGRHATTFDRYAPKPVSWLTSKKNIDGSLDNL